jgi:hypothetical protein
LRSGWFFEVDRYQVQSGGVPHFVSAIAFGDTPRSHEPAELGWSRSPVVIFSGRFIAMVIAFRTAVQPYPDSSRTNCPIWFFTERQSARAAVIFLTE